jgi:outer membrane receptor for ferrienterochelin and colicin
MIHEVKIEDVFNGYTYENFQNVVVSGLDFNARTRIIGALNLTTAYSYVNALDTETNQQLVGVSKHTGTMVLDYYRHFRKFTTGLTLSTKMYSAKDFINMDYTTGELHPDVYPAFSIWRLSTSLQLFNHSLVIYTGIDNLLNYNAISDLVSNEAPRRIFVKLNIEIDRLFNHFKN